MGLPIWREPEEPKPKTKADLTAAARSSIRRRPSIHGNRNRSRLVRESTVFGQREQLPVPPPPASISRYSRRNGRVGVPPISTLLESADRIAPPPPPPLSQRLRDFDRLHSADRGLVASLQNVHERAGRIHRDAQEEIRQSSLPAPAGTGAQATQRRGEHSRRLPHPGSRHQPTRRSHDRDLRRSRNLPWPHTRHPDDRPRSRNETAFSRSAPRSALPTPPLEQADPDGDSLFLPETNPRSNRSSHPLSRSWQPDSPMNGLGDRNRSPTPTDAWEIMQSTIAPDETLPSASSSFASNATHESLAPSTDTTITEPERESSDDDEDVSSDGASLLDAEDFVCREDEDMISATAQFARDMYYREMEYPDGRERIATLESQRREEGNRFALASEPQVVDIGFRLIEDALETEEGRGRVFGLQGGVEDEGALQRMVRFRSSAAPYHNLSRNSPQLRARSPPPRYSPLPAQSQSTSLDAPPDDSHWLTSRASPQPHAVSPPNDRIRREVDALVLSNDDMEAELSSMRRVIERLARRDDVPDEWWVSMGLENIARREGLMNGSGSGRGESRL